MPIINKIAPVFALISLSVMGVARCLAASATFPIVAQILRPVEISINTSLNFGILAMTNVTKPGMATIDPETGRLTVDSRGGLAFAGGTPTAGRMTIRGAPGPVNVTIGMPTMQIYNGIDSLTIENFRLLSQGAGGQAQGMVIPAGPMDTVTLNIGASLVAPPRRAEGIYTGINTIFANYQ